MFSLGHLHFVDSVLYHLTDIDGMENAGKTFGDDVLVQRDDR